MSLFLEQKELFDRVLLLGEEEMRDPMSVFERYFSDYRLHECRYILWSMVETCLTTENTEYSDPGERANLLLNYRNLERILEAGILLLKKHRAALQQAAPAGREKN
jgi:hypothetical protein